MDRIKLHPVLDQNTGRKTVEFTFDGQKLSGYENEMVSSALFANGIKEFSVHIKDDAPQGIFCANGQCSQCTVIIDGMPLKSCVTPLKNDMNIKTLVHLPEIPDTDVEIDMDLVEKNQKQQIMKTDVLVIGGGSSGLTSTIELAKLGFNVILVDDKEKLGGKLLLQTHKFFGSEADCYAGTRGNDIADILEKKVRTYDNVKVLVNSSIIGIFKDKKAGVYVDNKNYYIIEFDGMIISGGAREKSLVFPGNDLPGVFGAGAFQTLVNRDLIKCSDKVLIVGSGNVGLIGAYHALQANIKVAGIVEIAPKVGGYKVHADKIKRMGVPIYLNTTVLTATGNGKLEKVTIAEVDEKWNPILETARTYEVDTLLIAAGLTPVDEFYNQAIKFGIKVIKTGDADEIAEASSAMFGGKISGLKMARELGKDIKIEDSFFEKADILKSHPGKIYPKKDVVLTDKLKPIFFCFQEIPCNPCTTVCPKKAIKLEDKAGSIMDLPYFDGECIGCGICVAACPGLAITLAKKAENGKADVVLPHEYNIDFKIGDKIPVTDRDGEILEDAEVLKIRNIKKYKTQLVTVIVDEKNALNVAGIKVQDKCETASIKDLDTTYIPDNSIVCRCERVSLGELKKFIKENRVRDVNQLKLARSGMGACGSKTCSVLMPLVFRSAGVKWEDVKAATIRPLSVEIPMHSIINEKIDGEA